MTSDDILRIITEAEPDEQPILPKGFTCTVEVKEGLAEIGITDATGKFRGTYLSMEEITAKKVREAVKGVIASVRGVRRDEGKE
jgi:hypothetical protein